MLPRSRQVVLRRAATVLVLLVCWLIAAHAGSSSYPTDARVKQQFFAHQADFEKIVGMAEEDAHLVRIAKDFTWLDTDASWPRKDAGISQKRWDEYRRLFRRAGVPDGLSKDIGPPRIFLPIASRGLVTSGDAKGIAYSRAPLTPVLRYLDGVNPNELYDKRGRVIAFATIQDHWYIYYEAW